MKNYISFLPILSFIFLYVGTGVYCSLQGMDNAFYQLSPTVAVIPAIILGVILNKGSLNQKIDQFLDGARHKDIILMCIVFILAGAFSAVTTSIGSINSTINLALSLIPSEYLLLGLFIVSAFISTAIGTSMGTIATIAPIAAGLVDQGIFPAALAMGTIVGGAMFGDNLSIISDTTVASVMSQEADIKKKWYLNAKISTISGLITLIILYFSHNNRVDIIVDNYSLLLVSPYIFLILMALLGVNVFIVLISSTIFAQLIGFVDNGYGVLQFSGDISKGFASMQEIMLLSLLVGGLSGLASESSKEFAIKIGQWLDKKASQKIAQLVIAKVVSIFDILLANNTVAIIFSGEIARDIAKKYKIPPHYSAVWLDIFSCAFQGIIPYGAQILLASSIGKVSPLEITPFVFYCYVIFIVSVLYIMMSKRVQN
jgi:Na+/H+ antiporter NhaC